MAQLDETSKKTDEAQMNESAQSTEHLHEFTLVR